MLAPATLAALPSTRAIPDHDVFYVARLPSAPFASKESSLATASKLLAGVQAAPQPNQSEMIQPVGFFMRGSLPKLANFTRKSPRGIMTGQE